MERRRRLGQDLFDEVWEGVVHMNPAPHSQHGRLEAPASVDRAAGDVDGEQGGSAGAEHALEVGSGRDGVGDPVGAAGGERACEVATAAVPDQRDAASM